MTLQKAIVFVGMLAGTACFGQPLVGPSPFVPPNSGGVTQAVAGAYELAGSTVEGGNVSVCIFDRQKKHSQWISVGEEADGVRVVQFDNANDTVIVNVDGIRKELTMRKSKVTSLQPPMINPLQRDVSSTPMTVAQREANEARTMVNGVMSSAAQQRRAYEDARVRQGASTPQGAVAPAPSN